MKCNVASNLGRMLIGECLCYDLLCRWNGDFKLVGALSGKFTKKLPHLLLNGPVHTSGTRMSNSFTAILFASVLPPLSSI